VEDGKPRGEGGFDLYEVFKGVLGEGIHHQGCTVHPNAAVEGTVEDGGWRDTGCKGRAMTCLVL
jgi:hypothetical protein